MGYGTTELILIVFGFVLPPVIIIGAFVIVRKLLAAGEKSKKPCPFCAEMIKTDAVVCRYCKRDIAPKS